MPAIYLRPEDAEERKRGDAGALRHSHDGRTVYQIQADGSWKRLPAEEAIEAQRRFKRRLREEEERMLGAQLRPRDIVVAAETVERNEAKVTRVKLTHRPTGRQAEAEAATYEEARALAQQALEREFDFDAQEAAALR